MPSKEILSATAICLTLAAYYPYINGILRGRVRPHMFSWIIWGITTLVVFFAQLEAKGGAGAWAVGVSAAITVLISVLAWMKRADTSISTADWFFLATALASLPLWYLTSDPLWAVILLTVVDILGFGPTLRKVWESPWSESVAFYGIYVLRNGLVILALEQYSVTTWLFPAAIALACGLLMVLIIVRRRAMGAPEKAVAQQDPFPIP